MRPHDGQLIVVDLSILRVNSASSAVAASRGASVVGTTSGTLDRPVRCVVMTLAAATCFLVWACVRNQHLGSKDPKGLARNDLVLYGRFASWDPLYAPLFQGASKRQTLNVMSSPGVLVDSAIA